MALVVRENRSLSRSSLTGETLYSLLCCSWRYSAWRSGNKGKGGLNTTTNDPRSQMIPTIDHNQSPTANDFRVLPQMVLPKNAEFRRLTLQKVIIFLVYFSSPAWQREEVPCSTRDLQAAFSPLLAFYRRWLVFSTL